MRWDNPVLPGFIVFEGLDGAGTTTQAQRLVAHMNDHGQRAEFTWEPSGMATGRVIRELLAGPEHVDPWTLALLFAADRNEHLTRPETGIRATLAKGTTVVSDRYLFSSIAYQGAYCDSAKVEQLNHPFPLPEHLIFLDTALEEASRRLSGREKRDRLEQDAVQKRVNQRYRGVVDAFARQSETRVHRIDGVGTPDAVFAAIIDALEIPE